MSPMLKKTNRRDFFKVGATAAAGLLLPKYAFCFNDSSDRIKIAIVGCGRSGRKAALAMSQVDKNISIIAVADTFADCAFEMRDEVKKILHAQNPNNKEIFDVPNSRVFVGLDCYKDAIATDADIVVLATPPVFRPREFQAALEANKHTFLEKPLCVDPVGAREMFELAKIAKQKKLTALCGVQRRYHEGYREAIKRLHDGQIGRLISAQCFWLLPHFDGMELKTPPNADPEELEYQIRNWALFAWTSGDHIVEQQVHNLDIMRWGFARDPKEVMGIGGRAVNLPMPQYGNRFSHFAVDFDYGDGVHLQATCRQEPRTNHLVMERFVGTEGVLETNLFTRQTIRGKINWTAPDAPNCILQQHRELLKSVRNAEPINTVEELTNVTMMAIAGRISAYSGMKFKYGWARNASKENFFPKDLKFGKKPIEPLAVPGEYKLV